MENINDGTILYRIVINEHQMMEQLLSYTEFAHPISYTTNPNNLKRHRYITSEEFSDAEFLEKTMYGGYGYGTLKKDRNRSVVSRRYLMEKVKKEKNGDAIRHLWSHYLKTPISDLMVYCKQSKDKLIENILMKNCDLKEKKLRLLALEQERKHESLCDITVREGEVGKILEVFRSTKC